MKLLRTRTYQCETKRPKEFILQALRDKIAVAKKALRMTSFFNLVDYTNIRVLTNKIVFEVNPNNRTVIGEIVIVLSETAEGTLLTAETKPYESQLTIPFFGLLFSPVFFCVYGKFELNYSNSFLASVFFISLFVFAGLGFTAINYVEKEMKDYLRSVLWSVDIKEGFKEVQN